MRVITKGRWTRVLRPGVEVVRVEDPSGLRRAARPGDLVLLPATDIGIAAKLPPVETGNLRIDHERAAYHGEALPLGKRERRLLYELASASGEPVHRSDLWRACFGNNGRERNVDRVISRVRVKLRISTDLDVVCVRDVGYQLVTPTPKNGTLLILEDDPDMRRALERVFTAFDTDFAASIAEATELVRDKRYTAMIVDLMLPDGCGSTIVQHVRTKHPSTLVMIVSARSDPEALALSGRFGVPYCIKPADPVVFREFAARAVNTNARALGT